MSVIQTFSANLNALMGTKAEAKTNHKLGAVSGVAPSGIRRFQLGEVAAQIDNVEKVAKVFKLRACDILDPDLITRLKAGEPLRMGEPQPPVMPEADWRALSPRARAFVEEFCNVALHMDAKDIGMLDDMLQRLKPAAIPSPVHIPAQVDPAYQAEVDAMAQEAENRHAQNESKQRRRVSRG